MDRLRRNPNFRFKATAKAAQNNSCGGRKGVDAMLRKARACGVLDLQGILPQHETLTLSDVVRRYFLVDDKAGENASANSGQGSKWWEICAMTEMRLSHNRIDCIPENLFDEHGLKESLHTLYLDDNKLDTAALSVPLRALVNLKKLQASTNDVIGSLVVQNELPTALLQLCSLEAAHNRIATLPLNLAGHAPGMLVLDLSHNAIEEIAADLPRKLEVLKLRENKLASALPERLGSLSSLRVLDLSGNALTKFALPVAQPMALQSLDLTNNRLEHLRIPMQHFFKLDQLLLGFNQLCSLDGLENLSKAQKLTVLNASDNKLSRLPEAALVQCKSLKSLDISNNDLADLPSELGSLEQLQTIRIHGNRLKRMKLRTLADSGKTSSIKEYLRGRDAAESEAATEDLMHNKFSFSQDYRTISVRQTVQRPATTGNVKDDLALLGRVQHLVRTLSLAGCGMKRFEGRILEAFAALESVDVAENGLESVQFLGLDGRLDHVHNLSLRKNGLVAALVDIRSSALVKLDLSLNRLTSLPECLTATLLPNLKELSLAYNQLSSLPAEAFCGLSLRTLDLSNNKLEGLGSALFVQVQLEELVIENNDIRAIPLELAIKCPKLRTLLLSGNPQRTIRANIISKGSGAILEYMRAMVQPEEQPKQQEVSERKEMDFAAELQVLTADIAAKEKFLEENSASLSSAKLYALKKELAMARARKKRLERRIQA